MIAITPIPAFNDNYLWLIDNGCDAVVVDPGDAQPVERYLKQHGLNLAAILVTHHHGDHTGGIGQLKQSYPCHVYGPANESIPHVDTACNEGDTVQISPLALKFDVLEVPGHTAGHIAYFAAATVAHKNLLFCGDTVFSGGCGRLFEGTPLQMWQSMQKLMALPDDTLIHPAHEYTLSNLTFAQAVEPNNADLLQYKQQVASWREENRPSLPARLELEKRINPFMRIKEQTVIAAAEQRLNRSNLDESEVFGVIRHWKDSF